MSAIIVDIDTFDSTTIPISLEYEVPYSTNGRPSSS